MLELMARGRMRIGEVLKLRPKDIRESKLVISDPRGGKKCECVLIPKSVREKIRSLDRDDEFAD
jgi:integrase